MARVYEPNSRLNAKLNPSYCQADVTNDNGWGSHQCGFRTKRDGWCGIHHPDAEKERRRKSDERYERQRANSPVVRLRCQRDELLEAMKEIRVLCDSDSIASIEAIATRAIAAQEGK